MSVLIRRAGRRDLEGIHTLWRVLCELRAKFDPQFEFSSDAERVVREHREIVLADPRSAFFVAEERGAVLGYLHARVENNELGQVPPRFGVVVELCVREDRRRQRLGTRLFEYCAEWLSSLGISEVRAAVSSSHEAALRFLETVGASATTITLRAPL